MKRLKAIIAENKRIGASFYKMRVGSSYLASNSKPGQFVEVKCSDDLEPLLRRPLSVHRILNNEIEVLYEVIGTGTRALSDRKKGECIDIIGPLGKGFNQIKNSRPAILIAGGIGVAPLLALAEKLVHRKNNIIYVLIGACKKEHVLCANDFKKLGAQVIIHTEDGSLGKKGLITDGLISLLSTINYGLSTIYACGPTGMLKAVAKIAEERRISCQVSMEERMACGVGVCLGCPIKVKVDKRGQTHSTRYRRVGSDPFCKIGSDPFYKMVCKDGPVFDAKEIVW